MTKPHLTCHPQSQRQLQNKLRRDMKAVILLAIDPVRRKIHRHTHFTQLQHALQRRLDLGVLIRIRQLKNEHS